MRMTQGWLAFGIGAISLAAWTVNTAHALPGAGIAAAGARGIADFATRAEKQCNDPKNTVIDTVEDPATHKLKKEVMVFVTDDKGRAWESGCSQFGITPETGAYAKVTQICSTCAKARINGPEKEADAIEKMMKGINEKAACDDGRTKVQKAADCTKDVACNLVRSLTASRALTFLVNKYPPKDMACIGQKQIESGDCLTIFVKGMMEDLLMNKQTLKDAGGWVKKKLGFGSDKNVKKQENGSSDAMHAASNQGPGFWEKFKKDKWGTIKEYASNFYNFVVAQIGDTFGCKRWDGYECKEHIDAYTCANCSQIANMACGTLGFVGGEVVTNFLTGGTLLGLKLGAQGIAAGAKVAMGAEKAAALQTKFAKMGALFKATFGAIGETVLTKADAVKKVIQSRKVLKASADVISAVAGGAWKGAKGVGKGAVVAGKYTGVNWTLRQMDEAFMLGMMGKKARTAALVAETASKTEAARVTVGRTAEEIAKTNTSVEALKAEGVSMKTAEAQLAKADKLTTEAAVAGQNAEKVKPPATATYSEALKASRNAAKAEEAAEEAAKAAGKAESTVKAAAAKVDARKAFLGEEPHGPKAIAVGSGETAAGGQTKAVSATTEEKAPVGTTADGAPTVKAVMADDLVEYDKINTSYLTQKDRNRLMKYKKRGSTDIDYFDQLKATFMEDENFAKLCGPGVKTCSKQDDIIYHLLNQVEKKTEGDVAAAKAYLTQQLNKCTWKGR